MEISNHIKERYKYRVLPAMREESNRPTDTACRKKEIKKMVANAQKNGVQWNELMPYCPSLSYFVRSKIHTNSTRAKIYKGFLYIWRGKNKTATTVYQIPEKYMAEYNSAMQQISAKKALKAENKR